MGPPSMSPELDIGCLIPEKISSASGAHDAGNGSWGWDGFSQVPLARVLPPEREGNDPFSKGGAVIKIVLAASAFLLAGCAHTYNLPEAERSRGYQTAADLVWVAALASVYDIGLALVESEQDHGRIRARAGASIWDFKGHVLLVVVREVEPGRIRVDANAESYSEDEVIDFGRSGRIVRDYLKAMDARLGGDRGS